MKIKVKGIENQGANGKTNSNERSMEVLQSIIENYIKNETDEFVKLAQWLYREMPQLLEKFRQ